MDKDELKKYVGDDKIFLVDAMKMIDANSVGLIYVVDQSDRLIGCLTDGDIRRWIISGGDLSVKIDVAMNRDPKYVIVEDADIGMKRMSEEQIDSIAVVDDKMRIVDIIFYEAYRKLRKQPKRNALKGIPVIVMAGGKGTRLYPYTKILPKPLIPIGDIPIMERILNRFSDYGVLEFYVTVNYRKEMIKSYFSDTFHEYRIHYIDEEKPLGTAGSIRLIKKRFQTPVIVTNCDILIDADYAKVMDLHISSGNDMTIISSLKNTVIPYGVLHSKERGIVTSMQEKPNISYFINTGMYVINPEFTDWIPEDTFFHMTELADLLMKKGKQVGMYPVSENSFLDMGEFEEMKKMEERINAEYGK